MIPVFCEQRSPEWHEARLGIPTASGMDRIITATGKPSAQAFGYIHELLASWALGEDVSEFCGTYWTDRGLAFEPQARAYYELERGLDTEAVGFVYHDESRLIGCSPDWLVKDCAGGYAGGCELKCPTPGKHIGHLLDAEEGVPSKYRIQVQASLWITGLQWWDWMSYCPELPPVLVRVEPDEKLFAAFDEAIPRFIEALLSGREKLEKMGVVK